MKVFLIALAITLVCTGFIVFQQDYNIHQMQLERMKFVAEEAAAAAAQYYYLNQYADGVIAFNRPECVKAAEYVIKKNLDLQDDFNPAPNTYWPERVTYTIQYFDDTNTVYPYVYTHPTMGFVQTIIAPTVIITLNCGRARYRVPYITLVPPSVRAAAHEWKDR